jgi:hypothetical protein
MADSNGGSNTGVIAVLVMFLVIALGVGIFAFRGRIFGDAKQPDKVDINVTIPAK